MSKIVLGFVLQEREKSASKVQELLSEYGCEIRTRIGLHVASSQDCSPQGLILLDFIDNAEETVAKFEKALKEIADVNIQKMVF